MNKLAVAVVVGTRPEAIKLAPVILAMRQPESRVHPVVCVTGQHREMLDPVLAWFGIRPDYDLALMRDNQTLADLSARTLTSVGELWKKLAPSAVLVQGDTTTAAMAASAAFYARIPIGHVEAGLRTNDLGSPFPEEFNRRVITLVANLHFAPTQRAWTALASEGINPAAVHLVGNTVVDALRLTLGRRAEIAPAIPKGAARLVLVTAHRRESFGEPFEEICRAIRTLAERNEKVRIVYPVHLNPNVREPVERLLRAHPRVELQEPVNYQQMVDLMERSALILTDSGGVQEEASVLNKPTLILRETTERPEAMEAGTAVLVGTSAAKIVTTAEEVLAGRRILCRGEGESPFGDGFAAERTVRILGEWLAHS